MAEYKISVVDENNDKADSFVCNDDEYILDAAEDKTDLDLPYACRAGACSTCAGLIIEGEINQKDQAFLHEDQISNGYILTCVSYPLSDCKIKTHVEEDLY
ncbi:unnamed protein product [Choristocarpus tenellus]|uniref:ferredoxin n=1 Tax=Choristocarpus tenellus TaxID=116065 RepID=UPI002E777533|nr:ferredoxin [Choristocarpus tenellus]WAM62282.1 ferredoxin [Choristocarpus tenellus]